ncbi:MAG: substrate-binding domain-containing protein [Lentisphaerae bacterium]|nr:substrate-binding domain-containing protein [Lentisphaerota bacterium]
MQPSLSTFNVQRAVSLRRQIADHVRGLILSGQLPEHARLPSTQVLAAQWHANPGTVQQAMAQLMKEGLLWRAPRKGTYVRKPAPVCTRVAIYYPDDALTRPSFGFQPALHHRLTECLRREGGEVDIWVDGRPPREQQTPWEPLAQAAAARTVQGVILPYTDAAHLPWLRKLPIPLAAFTEASLPESVTLDPCAFYRLALEALQRQGCRTAGLIGVSHPAAVAPDGRPAAARDVEDFLIESARLDLRWRDAWVRHPRLTAATGRTTADIVADHHRHGYDAFRAIWAQRERPDGLIVANDVMATGTITAMLELGVQAGRDLRLVLHSNTDVAIFCPMPVTLVAYPTAAIAEALVGQLRRQWQGEPVAPVQIEPTVRVA